MRIFRFIFLYVTVTVLGLLVALFLGLNHFTVQLDLLEGQYSVNVAWVMVGAAFFGFVFALLLVLPGRFASAIAVRALARDLHYLEDHLERREESRGRLLAQHESLLIQHESLLQRHDRMLEHHNEVLSDNHLLESERDEARAQLAALRGARPAIGASHGSGASTALRLLPQPAPREPVPAEPVAKVASPVAEPAARAEPAQSPQAEPAPDIQPVPQPERQPEVKPEPRPAPKSVPRSAPEPRSPTRSPWRLSSPAPVAPVASVVITPEPPTVPVTSTVQALAAPAVQTPAAKIVPTSPPTPETPSTPVEETAGAAGEAAPHRVEQLRGDIQHGAQHAWQATATTLGNARQQTRQRTRAAWSGSRAWFTSQAASLRAQLDHLKERIPSR